MSNHYELIVVRSVNLPLNSCNFYPCTRPHAGL